MSLLAVKHFKDPILPPTEPSDLLKPDARRMYPLIERGEGVFLYDSKGRDYIDGSSGAMVANIGHGVQEIADAAHAQISKVGYTYRTQFTNPKSEELAHKIIARAGDKAAAFFLNSGSEANEAAIRLVLQHWRELGRPNKRRILSRRVSYHGNTLGSLSLSSDLRRQELPGMTIEEPLIDPPYCYRCAFRKQPGSCDLNCAAQLEDTIRSIGADNIAAFITEPIIGATGGAIIPPDGYFQKVREICDRHDILLVVDEVITGFGRVGQWFAMHHWGVSADMAILGKGINAGFTPLSAVLLSQKMTDVIANGSGRVTIGHTHSNNPTSAAICCAVIDYIQAHDLVARTRDVGPKLGKILRGTLQKYNFVGDVRGVGLLWGIEFVADPRTKRPFSRQARLTDRIVDLAFKNGLIIYPCRGLMPANQGDAILVAPPLVTTEAEMEILAHRLDLALQALNVSR